MDVDSHLESAQQGLVGQPTTSRAHAVDAHLQGAAAGARTTPELEDLRLALKGVLASVFRLNEANFRELMSICRSMFRCAASAVSPVSGCAISGAATAEHVKTTAESVMYRMNLAVYALDTRLARDHVLLEHSAQHEKIRRVTIVAIIRRGVHDNKSICRTSRCCKWSAIATERFWRN